MKRYALAIFVTLVMVLILLPTTARKAYALDDIGVAYNIGPVTYYDPGTGLSRPFMPIAWYYSFSGLGLPWQTAMANTGANTIVRPNASLHPALSDIVTELDRAQSLGLKEVIGFSKDLILYDPNFETTITTWVNTLKDHPALLGWSVGDENGGDDVAAGRVGTAVATIRANDPNRQIWQTFPTTRPVHNPDFPLYHDDVYHFMFGNDPPPGGDPNKHTDVLATDMYVLNDGDPLFHQSNWLLSSRNVQAAGATTYGWEGNVNVTQAVGPDIGPVPWFRFPTIDEYRWDVFSAIASAGARGTVNWTWAGDQWNSDPNDFNTWVNDTVEPVFQKLGEMSHAMETGYDVGTVTSNHDVQVGGENYNEVSHLLLHDDQTNEYFLTVTNNEFGSQSLTVTLSNLPVALSNLVAYIPETAESLVMQDLGGGIYQLDDTLGNHEVVIYKLNLMSGDVNGDGFVGGIDLSTVLTNWGLSGRTRTQGDLSGDGNVGGADYTEVLSNWGNGTLPSEPEPYGIPEPATLGLLGLGLARVFMLRRKR